MLHVTVIVIVITLGDKLLVREGSCNVVVLKCITMLWSDRLKLSLSGSVCILRIPSHCTLRTAYTHRNTVTGFKPMKN